MTDAEMDALIAELDAVIECGPGKPHPLAIRSLAALRDLRAENARLRDEMADYAYAASARLERLTTAEAALAAAYGLLRECAEHWSSQKTVPPESLAGRIRAAIDAARQEKKT